MPDRRCLPNDGLPTEPMTLLSTSVSAARTHGLALCLVALAGCSSTPPAGKSRAPVEDRPGSSVGRSVGSGSASSASAPSSSTDAARPAGSENAGKPGYYTVRPGDTLIRVGLEHGLSWRDLQRWNAIENADRIEVGQVLRVIPPGQDPAVAAARPVAVARVDARPLDGARTPAASGTAPASGAPAAGTAPAAAGGTAGTAAAAGSAAGSPSSAAVAASAPPVVAPVREPVREPARDGDDEPAWAWPAGGAVLTGFDEARNKGVAIGGKAGDPVMAAADGRVVYAGSGLRGYGNLIIVKHNDTYLTAYAHNQALLVKEDQSVKRGQKIAEMGSSEAPRVQLHFEIRRKGKPQDPAKLLPAR